MTRTSSAETSDWHEARHAVGNRIPTTNAGETQASSCLRHAPTRAPSKKTLLRFCRIATHRFWEGVDVSTGSVVEFDLHKLGWRAFEDLVAVIAREVLGQTVQIFADGQDGGRDGAFEGQWTQSSDGPLTELNGKIVIQCKFSKKSHANLTMSVLKDEFEKLEKLVEEGRCDSYLLVTNYSVSSEMAIKSEDEARRVGAKSALTFGKDWLNQTISTSDRLRRFVPRVYGLGDVSLIFDERSRTQSEALLRDLQPRLERYVLTSTYEKAAAALSDRRIIVLLGEPAVGKTLMAATLTLAALDEYSLTPFKVNTASELREHWNTNEPRIFWLDDAFGATRLDQEKAYDWESNFHAVMTAVSQGNRVILTSRSHLYRQAIGLLKDSTRSELGNRTIEIRVDSLTDRERAQMLYNHIRYGDQPQSFKTAIKPHLKSLAKLESLKPELARRLGSSTFTGDLTVSDVGLREFITHPNAFLVGIISELDELHKSALAAIFVSQGRLESPIDSIQSASVQFVLGRFHANLSKLALSLEAMHGTLVRLVTDEAVPYWTYFHPTIGEAFEAFAQANPELLSLLVRGASAATVVTSFDCNPQRAKATNFFHRNYVQVPPALHALVVECLNIPAVRSSGGIFSNESYGIGFRFRYLPFLQERVSDTMLVAIAERDEKLVEDLISLAGESPSRSTDELLARVSKARALSDGESDALVRLLESRAESSMDTEWIFGGVIFNLLSPDRRDALQANVFGKIDQILSNLAAVVYKSWEPTENPEDAFHAVLDNLQDLTSADDLPQGTDDLIQNAIFDVEANLSIASEEFAPEPDEDDRGFDDRDVSAHVDDSEVERDVFDDVDAD